jgi:MFS family permease
MRKLQRRDDSRQRCKNIWDTLRSPETRDWPSKMPPLYLTFALMLCCYSSISSARVILSLFALDLGAQPSAVGLLVATFYAFPLLLSWPVGVLSDRLGSRWLLLFGASCGACGMLIPYFFRALPALYIAGFTIGLSFTFYNVLLQNLVGLLSTPHDRTKNFSNSSMFGAATLFIGPLIGGFAIDHSGYANACFYSMALASTAVVLLAVWGGALPGGHGHAAPRASIRDMLKDPGMLRILATSSLVQMGQDLFQFYLPIYGHGIGLSASAIGAVLASFAGAYFVVRIIMPRLIARLGEEALLGYSFYVAAAGFVLVPFFKSEMALGVVAFMFGCGMGCGQPITTMLLFSRSAEGRSGETFGLRQTTNNVVRVTAPSLFGFIASAFGLLSVFGISAFMMGIGGMLTRPGGNRPSMRKHSD